LLKTFKGVRERYGFTHVRFPVGNSSLNMTVSETFAEWVTGITDGILKNLILDLCKAPFMDDMELSELNTFFECSYEIEGNEVPVNIPPIGLPISYIKSNPAISFDSHSFWRRRKIKIIKTNDNALENAEFVVYNICLEEDILSIEFIEWIDCFMVKFIDNEEVLRKYLNYSKYRAVFTVDFLEQFFQWKERDVDDYRYLLLLMKDIQLHPFTGGMGQTENLRSRGKEASKRITIKDRLSYMVERDTVTFIACIGHYEFH
jgi:Txe/YoeB family toxin of Txe-Axe toxin-antitoxin module